MTSLTIRPLKYADCPALVEMVQALADHHGDTARIDAQIVTQVALLGAEPWLRIFVADSGGTLLGYVAISRRVKLQDGLKGFDLHHLFVWPDHRGMAIGKRLLLHAEVEAARCGGKFLTIGAETDNHTAQGFYAAMGYDARPLDGVAFRKVLAANGALSDT